MYTVISQYIGVFAPTSSEELTAWNFAGAVLFILSAFYKARRSSPAIAGHALRGYLLNHAFSGATAAAYVLLILSLLHHPLVILFASNPVYLGLAGFAGFANSIVTFVE
jgi:hypothetical protein